MSRPDAPLSLWFRECGLTLPSSGLAPAAQAWPSFHSWPNLRRLHEPLMSNVRRRQNMGSSVQAVGASQPSRSSRRNRKGRANPAFPSPAGKPGALHSGLGEYRSSARANARSVTNVSQCIGPQPYRACDVVAAREASVALAPGLQLHSGMPSLCAPSATPNPSFEPTRSGRSLQAFISFSALRALPARAA